MVRLLFLSWFILAAACQDIAPSSPQPTTEFPWLSPGPATPKQSVATAATSPEPAIKPPILGTPARVSAVVDGDTLVVETRQGTEVVRLIGIDAPERGTTNSPPECYFTQATSALSALTPPGSLIWLEKDMSETDRYGRLLRYVWVERNGSWILVNEALVRQGAAVAREYPPDVAYSKRLLRAQEQAQVERRGLWGNCPPPTNPNQRLATPEANCDPSYPDFCLAPPPPDLDCRDIPYRRFRVLPPDPHHFDSDRDGVGCEAG